LFDLQRRRRRHNGIRSQNEQRMYAVGLAD
jgi:hypothetical protein